MIESGAQNPKSVERPLLRVRGLKTHFPTENGVIKAVDGVDFEVRRGEVFGLVGESGCGKSVTALSIMQLVGPPGEIVDGEVIFDGQSLFSLSEREMNRLRGQRISMIFQEPQASLNPVVRIGEQIAEVLKIHIDASSETAWSKSVELLNKVGIPDPGEKARAFPHEISGGQAQRVMIAMALAMEPQLLIADEPTTALDVTIQAQILDLIRELSEEHGTAVILITHDLGVVAEMCDRVAVMYAGRIAEQTDIESLFDQPLHPYSQGLISSIPILGRVQSRLDAVEGSVPDPSEMPTGCRFFDRCGPRRDFGLEICEGIEPDLFDEGPGHTVRCWLYEDHAGHKAPLQVTSGGGVEVAARGHGATQ